jgi:hypothetical protein
MNYEVDQYVEALKDLPSREIVLQTKDCDYYYFKSDILAKEITYSTDKRMLVREVTIPAKRAFEIISMNKEGKKPATLSDVEEVKDDHTIDLLSQDNINRFDNSKRKRKKKHKGNNGPKQQENH